MLKMVGPLHQTPKGNKHILVVMDQFSKLTDLYPIKNQKFNFVINALQTEYFEKIGIPCEVLTDNNRQFLIFAMARFRGR